MLTPPVAAAGNEIPPAFAIDTSPPGLIVRSSLPGVVMSLVTPLNVCVPVIVQPVSLQ